MTRLIALFAFLVLAGFLGIMAFEVAEPDLIAVIALTVALVLWDMVTASGRKDR